MSGSFTNQLPCSTQSRSSSSHAHAMPCNVGQPERMASTVGGAALVLAGLSRGKLSGLVLGLCGSALVYRGWTGHCQLYQALGVDTSQHNSATSVPAQQGVMVHQSLTINRPAEELFAFWRELKNLPRVMRHLESVEVIDEVRSRWTATGPLGISVQWEAEIFNERKPEMIAWRSLPGGQMDTAGSIHFKPLGHDRGTAMVVSLKYNPPAGKIGATIASLLGSGVEQELDEDLRRFKSLMEAGEAPVS